MPKPANKPNSDPVMGRLRFPASLLALLLALATIALFWPATRCDFVNYDDPDYVTENARVTGGLTLENLEWAFSNFAVSNWHPLTLLSHMLDCQLFGLQPWGHHLTSVLLHAVNALLVFLLLQQLTGAKWRSLLVAALFAVHPLHVESVAWVAERKDVLSTCFGMLTLLFYARYAQKTGDRRQSAPPKASNLFYLLTSKFYILSITCFALSLMSKAMLVTLPFVLLLLDYWPLKRFMSGPRLSTLGLRLVWRLLAEKIPFFVLAAMASVVTFIAQHHGGAMAAGEKMSFSVREGNALISYCRYLGKLFWPVDLAIFYPHPGHWPLLELLAAGLLLLGISVFLFMRRGRYPFMLMGWLWFVGTLVPVIGLVQVGEQSLADRYTYFPSLGVLILVIWRAHGLKAEKRREKLSVGSRQLALPMAGCAAVILCMGLTRQQLRYWRDSETLFRHALAVTGNNHIAHFNLGVALADKGQTDGAIGQFLETLRLKPDYAEARGNLGNALYDKGQTGEALHQYQEALCLNPHDAKAHNNLGVTFYEKGQIEEAIRQYQEALRLMPDFVKAHNNLGNAYLKKGRTDEAISEFQEALHLKPDDAEFRYNLGAALEKSGQTDGAIRQYQEAIRLKPDYAPACNNLGFLWASRGENLDQARALIEKAVQLAPDNPSSLDSLGWVLFKLNRPREALDQLLKAAEKSGGSDPSVCDHLGDVYTTLHQREQAAAAWRQSLAIEPNSVIQKKLDTLPTP